MRRFASSILGFACAALGAVEPASAQAVKIVGPSALGFTDIQPAVDAAVNGSVIFVAAGSYSGFTITDKDLVILAVSAGAELKGAIQVRNLSARKSVTLVGLSVTVPFGGKAGLVAQNNLGSLRLYDCTLRGGSGYSPVGPGASITSCDSVVFVACTSVGGQGAQATITIGADGSSGLNATSSGVALYGCQLFGGDGFEGWDYGGDGGRGAYLISSRFFASGCSFYGGDGGDATDKDGPDQPGAGGTGLLITGLVGELQGAVYINTGSRCRFEYCLFQDNVAKFGGAVAIFGEYPAIDAAPPISHCRFIENSASQVGGAISLQIQNNSIHLEQCLFAGNTAPLGGALHAEGGMGVVRNSTFVGNVASNQGGAAYFSKGLITNSILWDNQAPVGMQVGGSVEVRYSDLQSHMPPVVVGPGTITLDPLFVDPDGPDNNPATFGDNDYRLLQSSPCIDASDNRAMLPDFWDLDGDGNFTEPMPFDLARAPRFRDVLTVPDTGNGAPPIADMGVFEHQP